MGFTRSSIAQKTLKNIVLDGGDRVLNNLDEAPVPIELTLGMGKEGCDKQ